MLYSLSTLKRKASKAGYSFQKGYQRWNHEGWGYVTDDNGDRIVGYQILDVCTGYFVYPSTNDLHDHALDLEEAVKLLQKLCAERGINF